MLVSQINHARISIAFEQLFFCVATIRNDIYARPYPGTRGNALIAVFIKRPHSGEPQDEHCCRRSLKGRAIFCEIAQVGHSRGYEFLNSGDVKSVLVGRRRLVLIRSWYDYLERLLEEQRTFTPGRHPASRQSPPSEPADPPPAQGSPPPRRRGRPRKYPRLADTADPAPAAANQRWADARRRAAVLPVEPVATLREEPAA